MASSPSGIATPKPRLGATFHRSFTLVRDAVGQVLQVAHGDGNAAEDEDCLSKPKVRELTTLGTIYVEAMPRYALGMGLLNEEYCLTPFGQMALQHDLLLDKLDTLWLMHYFLSAPRGPGPVAWHELVAKWFSASTMFKAEQISSDIAASFERTEGKPLSPNSAERTATAFLGTYTKQEALGKIGVLKYSPKSKQYCVQDPENPSAWAFGYALLHYWQSQYGDRVTINLEDLYAEGALGSIFFCGAGRVNRLLSALQAEGFVDVFRVAPPYQLVLLRTDAEYLLHKMYASHDSF